MESSGGDDSSLPEEAEVELGKRSELQMDAEQATGRDLGMRRSDAKEKEKVEEERRREVQQTFQSLYWARLQFTRAKEAATAEATRAWAKAATRAKAAAVKATRAKAAAAEAEATAAKAVEAAAAAEAEAVSAQAEAAAAENAINAAKREEAAAEAEAAAAEKAIEAAMPEEAAPAAASAAAGKAIEAAKPEEAAGKFEAAPAVAEAAAAKAEEASDEAAAEEEMRPQDTAAVEEEEDVEKEIQRWKEEERQNDEVRQKIYLEDKKRLDEENKKKERSLKEKRNKKQNKQRKKKMAPKAQEAAKTVEPEESAANDAEPANEEDEEEMWYLAKEARYLKQAAEMRRIGEYQFAKYLEKTARDARKTPWEADADPNAYQARLYRDNWDKNFGEYGPFDKSTSIPPSCFTKDYHYSLVSPQETLQLFSIKVGEIKKPLEWPLDVFGLVAVRDVVDRNRNMVFHRKRDTCQTITEKDPYLTLTGPTRAVVASVHPTDIEVDLKVKGSTESEDKDLSFLVVSSFNGGPCYRAERSKLSTLELTYFRIDNSVEAVISVKVESGSWPCGFRGLFTASTASFKRLEVVLLALEGDKLPIGGDGKIELSRSVICVEHQPKGKLIVSVQALNITKEEDALRGDQFFTPKQAGTSIENLKVGSVVMQITVTWSLLSTFKSAYDAVLEKRRDL